MEYKYGYSSNKADSGMQKLSPSSKVATHKAENWLSSESKFILLRVSFKGCKTYAWALGYL